MFGMARNTLMATLVAFLAFGAFMAQSPEPVSAQTDDCGMDVIECCLDVNFTSTACGYVDDAGQCAALYGLFACGHAADAFLWAGDVTDWKFGEGAAYQDAGMANAFKHCAWIGALATRIGFNDAYTIGFIHESRLPEDDPNRLMDDWNNYVGAGIGVDAVESGVSDQWGYVLDQCESRARSYQLYGPGGVQGGYA